MKNYKFAAIIGLTILTSSIFIAPSFAANTKVCNATQAIEEGPYYLANSPVRSDVTDGQSGKAMTLNFTIVDTSCKPIKGARIDIW